MINEQPPLRSYMDDVTSRRQTAACTSQLLKWLDVVGASGVCHGASLKQASSGRTFFNCHCSCIRVGHMQEIGARAKKSHRAVSKECRNQGSNWPKGGTLTNRGSTKPSVDFNTKRSRAEPGQKEWDKDGEGFKGRKTEEESSKIKAVPQGRSCPPDQLV